MNRKNDRLECDNLFINKVFQGLIINRHIMLNGLEIYLDEINDWMSLFDKEELDKKDREKAEAILIFLAKALTLTTVFKDIMCFWILD